MLNNAYVRNKTNFKWQDYTQIKNLRTKINRESTSIYFKEGCDGDQSQRISGLPLNHSSFKNRPQSQVR